MAQILGGTMSNVQGSALSADTHAMMAFQAGQKSTGTAFLFWFFLGGVGGHRFYLGKTGSAVTQLIMSVMGWLLVLAAGFGLLLLIPLGIWLLIDAFSLSSMVQAHNAELMKQLNMSATRPAASVSAVDELGKFAELRAKGAISDAEYDVQKQRLIGTTPAPASIVPAPIDL